MVHNRQCYLFFICLAPISCSRRESALCPTWSGVCLRQSLPSDLRRKTGSCILNAAESSLKGPGIQHQHPPSRIQGALKGELFLLLPFFFSFFFFAINSYSHFLSINKGWALTFLESIVTSWWRNWKQCMLTHKTVQYSRRDLHRVEALWL